MEAEFSLAESPKNTPKSSWESRRVNEAFRLGTLNTFGPRPSTLHCRVKQRLIQMYLAVKGEAALVFNEGRYRRPFQAGHMMLLYNPEQELHLEIEADPGAQVAVLYLSVAYLHELFVEGSEEIAFVNAENAGRKFYTEQPMSPTLHTAAGQLFQAPVEGAAREVYRQSKALEVLALTFAREEATADVGKCPFLKDEQNVARIKAAKEHIMSRYADHLTLPDLAQSVGISEYRLKEGFKNIYGKTVFQFLSDYRLEMARKLLDDGDLKVSEAAYQIGYHNPSHFIAAFRKKFGLTPKKYLQKPR